VGTSCHWTLTPPSELTTFSEEDVARMPVLSPGPVTLQNRQGVFVHAFKCSICDLEFMVFSWRANRHRTLLRAHPRSLQRGPQEDLRLALTGSSYGDPLSVKHSSGGRGSF